MAARRMDNDGTLRSLEAGRKNSPLHSESVSFTGLRKSGVKLCGIHEQYAFARLVNLAMSYAMYPWCNDSELSSKLSLRHSVPVSLSKHSLPFIPEVTSPASAIHSEDSPATFSTRVRVPAAAPRVTEFRRERCHPAGRQCRYHESRAPRRAGSQG